MLKGAIFDMDGLLLDTERLYAESWGEAAKAFGQEPAEGFAKAVCGTNGGKMLEVIHSYYPAVDAKAFMEFCIHRVEELLKVEIPEKPGMREILKFFQENNVRMAVASSTKLATIEDNLQRLGVISMFSAVVSGQQVAKGKPAPDIFLLAAKQIGCKAEECYVFEDSANGIRAGRAAGCCTIMIPDLTLPDEELKGLATGIYGSLTEAMEAIGKGEI